MIRVANRGHPKTRRAKTRCASRHGAAPAGRELAQRRRNHRRFHARPGYSLVELLVSVAIFSTVMIVAAVSMRALYRANRQLKDNAAYDQTVPRLALRLRTDVHAASDVAIFDSTMEATRIELTLTEPDERIEFLSDGGRVIRTRRRGEEDLHREVYALGKLSKLHWRVKNMPRPILELKIVRAAGKIAAPDAQHVDQIDATIGLHNLPE